MFVDLGVHGSTQERASIPENNTQHKHIQYNIVIRVRMRLYFISLLDIEATIKLLRILHNRFFSDNVRENIGFFFIG